MKINILQFIFLRKGVFFLVIDMNNTIEFMVIAELSTITYVKKGVQ